MRTFLWVLPLVLGLGMVLCGSFVLGFYVAQSVGASELWSNVGGFVIIFAVFFFFGFAVRGRLTRERNR